MRVDCAILCDSVTVREGLLHILGGGVTRLARPNQFPAPLGVDLALLLSLHQTEAAEHHVVQILVQGPDGNPLAQVQIDFGAPGDLSGLNIGEDVPFAIPVPLAQAGLVEYGAHSVEIVIDSEPYTSLPFWVTEQIAQPPI